MNIISNLTITEFSKTEQTYLRLIGENLLLRRNAQKSKSFKKFQSALPDYNYGSELLWFSRFLPEVILYSPSLRNSLQEDVEKVLQEPNLFTTDYILGIFPLIIALSVNNYLTDAVEGSMVEWCLDYFSVDDVVKRVEFQNRIAWIEKQLHYTETTPIIKDALKNNSNGKYLSLSGISSAYTEFDDNELYNLYELEFGHKYNGVIDDKLIIANGFANEYVSAMHKAIITMTSVAIYMSKLGTLESQTELIDTSSLHIILQQRLEESMLAKSELVIGIR